MFLLLWYLLYSSSSVLKSCSVWIGCYVQVWMCDVYQEVVLDLKMSSHLNSQNCFRSLRNVSDFLEMYQTSYKCIRSLFSFHVLRRFKKGTCFLHIYHQMFHFFMIFAQTCTYVICNHRNVNTWWCPLYNVNDMYVSMYRSSRQSLCM